ncbi:FAD-dependent oxidoreductase [Polyangium sorediatum]|uniref:FAD-dependent oxidoreductase n=1 Tax=Polyangium sorediatum TaxID=889274 RepID=A0ABT6P4H3_9BACT|nr:FAD-dependent oxidoreductase [Polyangium sorediatum]MDI1435520.1 FAD-dependent oxidoreductase [Polyangium sorediatum]
MTSGLGGTYDGKAGGFPDADEPLVDDDRQTLVIIGNGMVSYRLCQKLVENGVNQSIRIVVFGEERFPAYDRVHLTDIFGGRDGESLILAEEDWYESHGIDLYLDDPIVYVDREHSFVESYSGRRVPYNRLVFATGSEPFVPPIEGMHIKAEDGSKRLRRGVFVYRTFDDVYNIEAHVEGSLRVAVIGGGLLGLEAAKAIYDLGRRLHPIEVQVIEVAPGLMPRQLDAQGAVVLKEKIEELGVKIQVGKKIKSVLSTKEHLAAKKKAEQEAERQAKRQARKTLMSLTPGELAPGNAGPYRFAPPVDDDPLEEADEPKEVADEPEDEGLEDETERLVMEFEDGKILAVDMIIVSTGIRPRGDIAKAAGITCAANGGILVDDRLQTSDEQIFAIGECASHGGITYGLVAPGYQMVTVLVANLLGENAEFKGADQSAKLKLLGVTVAALGEYDGDTKPLSSALRYTTGGVYRKLVTRQGKLIGAVTVGDWENLDRIRDALTSPVPMSFFDMRRFRSTGNLFAKEESKKVTEWADEAVVCGCMRVTRGTLSLAIVEGCGSVEALCSKTGAGTVCGSCKPLIAELLGVDENGALPVAVPAASVRMGERPALRKDRAPTSRRTMTPAPVSQRRPTFPGAVPRSSTVMNIVMPGSPPSSGGRVRRKTLPLMEIPPGLADFGAEAAAAFAPEPTFRETSDGSAPSSRRMPSSRPPASRPSAGLKPRPSSRPPTPSAYAEGLEAAIRALAPPALPEDEAEVGLSSDRAPALLSEEPARAVEDLQITPLPPLPAFFEDPAINDGVEEDDAEDEYAEEAEAAFRSLDEGVYDYGYVQARRSWVPPKRVGMLPPAEQQKAAAGTSVVPRGKESVPPEPGIRPLLVASIGAFLLSAVAVASRPIPVPTTIAGRLGPARMLTDDTFKQVSGYVLLGLCVVSLVLSLRKRWRKFTWLDVPMFRAIHGVIGASTIFALVVHTGLRLGHHLNLVLSIDFLAVCVLGAIAGVVTSISNRWGAVKARDRRLLSSRAHLIVFWPLPVLVALHVVQVYYY